MIVVPKSSILFFCVALFFIVMYSFDDSNSSDVRSFRYSHVEKPAYKTASFTENIDSYISLLSSSEPKKSVIDNFLSKQNESSCDAVYDPSLVQKAISLVPQIADKIKGMTQDEQYRACVKKIRSLKRS